MSTGVSKPNISGWRNRSVFATSFFALAAGFGQFGLVAALGRVAHAFGVLHNGATFADQAGISATTIGIGLGISRLASLFGLPIAASADRFGRRPTLIWAAISGLALTVLASTSPSFWWFVAIFALGRPSLSAVISLSIVVASETTSSTSRASAVSLVAGSYASGAGLAASINAQFGSIIGFRGLFALCVIPLLCLPIVARWITEPERFKLIQHSNHTSTIFGVIAFPYRTRLFIIVLLAFGVSIITGPANSFVFLYAENVRHLSGNAVTFMVVTAGVVGLGGLLLGRWLADHVGRRPVTGLAIAAVAVAGIVTYSGSPKLLIIGYLSGVGAGGIFTPAAGALVNELFPTAVRASTAGWQIAAGVLGATLGLVCFGLLAQESASFGVAADFTFGPAILFAFLLFGLPETMGVEPEELWST